MGRPKPATERMDLYVSVKAETRAQAIAALKRIVLEMQAGGERGESSSPTFEANWHFWGKGERERLLSGAESEV